MENQSCIFVALQRGTWYHVAASLLLPSHVMYFDGLLATPSPFPPYTPNTSPWLSASPGMVSHLLSSSSHTPPPTGYPLHERDGIPFQPYSQHFSTGSPNRTAQPGCLKTPTIILGLMNLPCRNMHRRRNSGVVPPIRDLPERLLSILPLLPSVGPLRPLPR